MSFHEIQINAPEFLSDIVGVTADKKLAKSVVQTEIFATTLFSNVDTYTHPHVLNTPRIAQMVQNMGASAKKANIAPDVAFRPELLASFKEMETLAAEEWIDYQKEFEAKIKEINNASGIDFSTQHPNFFRSLQSSKMASIGNLFAKRKDYTMKFMQNSLLSKGYIVYTDSDTTRVTDPIKTPLQATTPWQQTDAALPITDLKKMLEKMDDNNQVPSHILFGKEAMREFWSNSKEVASSSKSFYYHPDIEKNNTVPAAPGGARYEGKFQGIPMYSVSNKVEVPQASGRSVLQESFATNAVSIVATDTSEFKNVFGSITVEDAERGLIELRNKEIVVFVGNTSSDKMHKDVFCAFKYLAVCDNSDCLEILMTR